MEQNFFDLMWLFLAMTGTLVLPIVVGLIVVLRERE